MSEHIDVSFARLSHLQPHIKLHSRYTKVEVLLLRWEEEVYEDPDDIEELGKVFSNCYIFSVTTWLIPMNDSHLALMGKTMEFIQHNNDEDCLLIVYYGGLAYTNEEGQSVWTCGRENCVNPPLKWTTIETIFFFAKSDLLLLLDCCMAPSTERQAYKTITEIIAAGSSPEASDFRFQRQRSSFTRELMRVLGTWRDVTFSAIQLHHQLLLNMRDRRHAEPNERIPSPVYTGCVHSWKTLRGAQSIVLSKLERSIAEEHSPIETALLAKRPKIDFGQTLEARERSTRHSGNSTFDLDATLQCLIRRPQVGSTENYSPTFKAPASPNLARNALDRWLMGRRIPKIISRRQRVQRWRTFLLAQLCMFLMGLVTTILWAVIKHDIGTAVGLGSAVWAVMAFITEGYKKVKIRDKVEV